MRNQGKAVLFEEATMPRRPFDEARQRLESTGWEAIGSATYDPSVGTEYGALYTRNGVRFWLNLDTYRNLPQD